MGKQSGTTVYNDACPVEMQNTRGRVQAVFDCRGCPGGSDLAGERCWNGVMNALSGSGDVDSIVLAGYTQTEYSGDGLNALSRFLRLKRSAERLSGRAPPSDGGGCATCHARPGIVFSACALGLGTGFRGGQAALLRAGERLRGAERAPSCSSCLDASSRELAYLSSEFERAGRETVRSAYGIVSEER